MTLLGRFSGRKNAGGGFEATVTGFAVGTVCLLPMALLEGMLPDMERAAWTLGLILYLGAVPTALAYTLFFVGLGAVRATTASVVALVEPLTAAVIGVLVFDERLNAVVLTGTACCCSPCSSSRRAKGPAERRPDGPPTSVLAMAGTRRIRPRRPRTDADAACVGGQWAAGPTARRD
ncbi:EamA family transporter [Streptomyces stelliscabiei]|uniref:EamA family transporter n=1 Tax=Streptomyces stelliscabiei TaxID=146820 RepID=UPI002FF10489